MSDQTNSPRASILFDGPISLNFIDLINELQRVFRNIALEFDETALAEGSHVLFQSEGMILRIGLGPDRFNPDLLRGAQRPAKPKISTAMIDALLEEVRETVEVSVEPGAGRALPERTLLAACYHVVRHMMRRYEASMVHWQHTGTLFTAEEFQNPITTDGPQPRRPERNKARRQSARPDLGLGNAGLGGFANGHAKVAETFARLDESAATAMEHPPEKPREDPVDMAREEARLRRARQTIFGSDLIETADTTRSRPPEEIGLVEQLTVYVMTVTIMVLSFPVGFAMLIYNVLRGENLRATARVMALTGTGVGLLSSNAPQALALLF